MRVHRRPDPLHSVWNGKGKMGIYWFSFYDLRIRIFLGFGLNFGVEKRGMFEVYDHEDHNN